ncbi:unnamed protein product [Parnassius apollo]|uniref:(apollo) hypothetical protein n=1 Tax=Parnassius apollo TaxID=110799 RepID=A0A8S3XCL2_PARAO|nr:unnamed protein product [Parnassius apollo]
MLSKSEDYSTIKMCEMQEMKEEIKELKINLLSTQNELENTIIENNEYKREINKLKKEIEVLKKICQSPIIKSTFIKTFASTEEVLKLCPNLEVDTHDKNSQNICKASWKLIKDVTESEPPQNYITHMKYENSIITNGPK